METWENMKIHGNMMDTDEISSIWMAKYSRPKTYPAYMESLDMQKNNIYTLAEGPVKKSKVCFRTKETSVTYFQLRMMLYTTQSYYSISD